MSENSSSTASTEPESSDSLKTFGVVFKGFRKRAGLTQEELAPLVRYAAATIASIEQGRRLPPRDLVERAEDVLDGFGVLKEAARFLARKPGLASWFRQWADLEEQAITLYTYECRLVPGLLQTEAYARTLFAHQLPPLDDEQVEAQLLARGQRQQLLRERPNTTFGFILEEHVLLRRIGGLDVTREVIERIIALAELRNVELQVMPLVRETHAGLDGPIRLLETPDNQWFAYCEGQRNGQFMTDLKEISILQRRYARMRGQALPLEDSLSLLRQMRGAL
ncbi:helix-turn-helix transcriptional regulator [Streptomyces sp. NPDC050704]|uniref:helix-turn-helix domain-containing protein n=1 Tax=Streptomyces sp. NPDC050704 TaxID=3157219 RepID=UPI00342DD717